MKKFLLALLFIPIACTAFAQDYKIFIGDDGKTADLFKATSYITIKQLSDTVWFMQQYDMGNTILQSGTFKDKNLQTPNGKFVYYRKLDFYNNKQMQEWLKSDTTNCILTDGSFKDGKKEGLWRNYFIGGKIREQAFYKNGVLNGPYDSYNADHSTVGLSGNYVDGKREGEWKMYNLEGNVMETESYRKGKVYKRKMSLGPYNPSKPPQGFEAYVNDAFGKATRGQSIGSASIEYKIIFTVATDGKIIKPELMRSEQSKNPLGKTLLGIIANSPLWKPANNGDETKPIDELAAISIDIAYGKTAIKILDYSEVNAAYYNLNH